MVDEHALLGSIAISLHDGPIFNVKLNTNKLMVAMNMSIQLLDIAFPMTSEHSLGNNPLSSCTVIKSATKYDDSEAVIHVAKNRFVFQISDKDTAM